MPQLDPTWFVSQIFWLAICMAVLYVALSRFILPKLMGVVEARHTARMADLDAARRMKESAEHAKREYEAALQDARLRAQSIFADAELAAKLASEKALAEVTRTVAHRIDEAERRIAMQQQQLLSQMQPTIHQLAGQITARLTGGAVEKA